MRDDELKLLGISLVEDPSLKLRDDQIDDWDTLRIAMQMGWVDPGVTEPLRDTVARARAYLNALPAEGST